MDSNAKLTGVRECFILPLFSNTGAEPLVIYGKAVLFAVRGQHETNKRDRLDALEIAYPDDRKVYGFDKSWQNTVAWVPMKARDEGRRMVQAQEDADLNFQAIFSDERFVAAGRVVAPSSPSISNARSQASVCARCWSYESTATTSMQH